MVELLNEVYILMVFTFLLQHKYLQYFIILSLKNIFSLINLILMFLGKNFNRYNTI